MLARVLASLIMLFSITCTSNFSASFHQPWSLYVDARLAKLISVSGPNIETTSLRARSYGPPLGETGPIQALILIQRLRLHHMLEGLPCLISAILPHKEFYTAITQLS